MSITHSECFRLCEWEVYLLFVFIDEQCVALLQGFWKNLYYQGRLPSSKGRGQNHSLSVIHLVKDMNKQDLAESVQGVLGSTKADAERAVESIIDAIVKGLKGGEEISIAGLGIFKTKMRAARTARNPRTGESVAVPAMRVPKFQPAKALKDAVGKK